ncbi:hypothetical protein [Qipengyuania sediminis]|uniref:hypothetical protein n=1 Tax=Qipengyuania sediminis TaxID=1532023 RepID=UPI00105A8E12|nr:hypothetical protein [Qipengyuania sediminis]
MRVAPLSALTAVLVSGCAANADRYPSLAVRDVERAQGRFEPIAVPPIAVPEVAVPAGGPLPQRLAALTAQAEGAHRRFTAAAPRAGRLAAAARGGAVGSKAWADAQVALADLDAARSLAAVALADLDTLAVAATVQAEDRAAIEAAHAQVLALLREEDAVLARLRAQVR